MPPHQHPVNMYILGHYVITYDASMKTEVFSCESYNGITFFTEEGRYQVINNYHMGPRIVINLHDGSFRDMPFKPDTFDYLPKGTSASELKNEGFEYVCFTR